MKKYLYITILVFLILSMLVQVIPASAEAVKTPVSGTATYLGDPDEQPVKFRFLMTGRYDANLHWKNYVIYWTWASTDPRLSGVSVYEANIFLQYTVDGLIKTDNVSAKETIYTNDDFTEPIWRCQVVFTYNMGQENQFLNENCTGVGINKGLEARLVFDSTGLNFGGYILDTGGE
jgi:hypothetical protein